MIIIVKIPETLSEADKVLKGSQPCQLSADGLTDAIWVIKDILPDTTGPLSGRIYIPNTDGTDEMSEIVDIIKRSKKYEKFSIHHEAALNDRSGGTFEGRRYTDLRSHLSPRDYRLWDRDYFEAPEMGESLMDVANRVIPFFEHVVRNSEVSIFFLHDAPMKVLVGHLCEIDEPQVPALSMESGVPYVMK